MVAIPAQHRYVSIEVMRVDVAGTDDLSWQQV